MTDHHAAAVTDVGQRRSHNEDSVYCEYPLFIVADGVGGAEAGEVASQAAVETISAEIGSVLSAPDEAVALAELERAVHRANARIAELQAAGTGGSNMATTTTAAVIWNDKRVLIAHVGDSRAYMVDGTGIRQLTDDHSVVGELVRSGEISEADAAIHPQRNVITRALGADPNVVVDVFGITPPDGAWLVLCSDGLTNHVGKDEIAAEVYGGGVEAEATATALVGIANQRGGTDNISVVLVQPVPADLAPPGGWEDGHPPQGTGEIRMPNLGSGAAPEVKTAAYAPPPQSAAEPKVLAQEGFHVPTWVWLALAAIVVGAGVVIAWSNSYYLVERDNGRIGINQGFPVGGLNRTHATGTLNVEDLPASDRESLLDSTTLRSKESAERLLAQLPERVDTPATTQSAVQIEAVPNADTTCTITEDGVKRPCTDAEKAKLKP